MYDDEACKSSIKQTKLKVYWWFSMAAMLDDKTMKFPSLANKILFLLKRFLLFLSSNIHLIPKWRPIYYSFICVLISLTFVWKLFCPCCSRILRTPRCRDVRSARNLCVTWCNFTGVLYPFTGFTKDYVTLWHAREFLFVCTITGLSLDFEAA